MAGERSRYDYRPRLISDHLIEGAMQRTLLDERLISNFTQLPAFVVKEEVTWQR
jgi:hypothetical protein